MEITSDNTVNVTLDTTVFKVVASLPESTAAGDENKIHLVPAESTEEGNIYTEYVFVNGKWEEFGTYGSNVDLAPYLTKEDAGKTYQKITDDTLETTSKKIVRAINEVKSSVDVNSYKQYLRKVYEEYGAVYNDETGFWELNGLTDMTEEDMFNCYMALFNYGNMSYRDSTYHTLVDFGAAFNGKCRTYFDNAASKQVYAELDCGVCGRNMFYENSKLEVLAFGNGSYIPKVIGAADGMFYGCSKLRDAGYWNFQYATFDSRDKGMFWSCDSLSRIYLYHVEIDLDLEDSPLLHYDSLSYLVNNANTRFSEITVTVHPNTYSYLNGNKTPPPEVGGTSSGWTSLRQTALNNNITFA